MSLLWAVRQAQRLLHCFRGPERCHDVTPLRPFLRLHYSHMLSPVQPLGISPLLLPRAAPCARGLTPGSRPSGVSWRVVANDYSGALGLQEYLRPRPLCAVRAQAHTYGEAMRETQAFHSLLLLFSRKGPKGAQRVCAGQFLDVRIVWVPLGHLMYLSVGPGEGRVVWALLLALLLVLVFVFV